MDQEQGPQDDDIEKFKAQYQKSVELGLKDNSFWLSYLLNQCENKDDLLQVQDIDKNLGKIDAPSLQKVAQLFFSGKNMITFELLPEDQKVN